MFKQEINIVWFKRDLRFTDHEPLSHAQNQKLPILLIFCFEPSIMSFPDSDIRHWRFVFQSLQDMQQKLERHTTKILIFHEESLHVFNEIVKKYKIVNLFSHQEIGNQLTYKRDIAIAQFCINNHINWLEFQHNGVIRKLKSRKDWQKRWQQTMEE